MLRKPYACIGAVCCSRLSHVRCIFFVLQISHGLSDGLLSSDIRPHPRGLVPVLLEEDQDMEEGIRKQMGLYGDGKVNFW
jgi:hypothetical protein